MQIFNCDRRHAFIDDDMSRDIFGDDGLAELNEALRQLEDIKLSLGTGSFILNNSNTIPHSYDLFFCVCEHRQVGY